MALSKNKNLFGWYNYSIDITKSLMDKGSVILDLIRQIIFMFHMPKNMAKEARLNLKDGIILAKSSWFNHLVEHSRGLSTNHRDS